MKLMGTLEVAKELGVCQQRVGAMIRAGRLKAVKLGKTWIIQEKDLEAVRVRTPGRPRHKEPGRGKA